MMKKTIIELFGLPGSGKTTCRNKLVQQLRLKGFKAYSQDGFSELVKERYFNNAFVLKKITSKVIFKLEKRRIMNMVRNTHPHYIKFINIALNEFEKQDKKILKGFIETTLIHYKLFELYSFDDEIMVIDEGLVHRALSLYGYNMNHSLKFEIIIKYLKIIPYHDIVIYIHADKHVAKNRVLLRGLPKRMQSFNVSKIDKFYNLNEKMFDTIDNFFQGSSYNYLKANNNSESETELDYKITRLLNDLHLL